MIKENDLKLNTEKMIEAGLIFGHKKSKTHPKMKKYISGVKNDIHIFDIEKTSEKLKEALNFIYELVSNNKTILFVGTKIQIKDILKDFANEVNCPYINERWCGGTFTNFEIVRKRIEYFKNLELKKEKGELEKYTKKEQMKLDKKIKELEKKFGGIKNLEKLPDAIFILDIKKDYTALLEAKKKGIPVIAIVDTNVNPDLVNYPIPANDDAISSIKYILDVVKEVILKAKNQ
ncbi:MAG TPA: 30S ribosomal protein S2 [Candidatus Pacearchaeota archaeon]|nr:30S ribosomal protein S2 [Candidatus Pacearchaeota archaeon]HPO68463.1 30S ribosomal protein S2 [Candidatus Pacearchaeota archaeon]